MARVRTIICSICEKQETEKGYGEGWKGWGAVKGMKLKDTDDDQLDLCPTHLGMVFKYVEDLMEEK